MKITPTNLPRLRKKHNVSRAELARAVGVTEAAVGHWERGDRQPGRPALMLAETFFEKIAETGKRPIATR